MRNYVGAGWAFLIAGSIILGLFLALLLFSCLYLPTIPRGSAAPGVARCYFLNAVYPEIIIGIAMIVIGLVLRSLGRKKK